MDRNTAISALLSRDAAHSCTETAIVAAPEPKDGFSIRNCGKNGKLPAVSR